MALDCEEKDHHLEKHFPQLQGNFAMGQKKADDRGEKEKGMRGGVWGLGARISAHKTSPKLIKKTGERSGTAKDQNPI